jgi:hypothetical protein
MKTLQEILGSDALKPYVAKADELQALNALWSMTMHEWASHCRIANFERGVLVLQAENAAWASRIRYATPEIFKQLAFYSEFGGLQKVEVILSKYKIVQSRK